MNLIPDIDASKPVPEDAKCQEASIYSIAIYIPCDRKATFTIYHARDRRAYHMCPMCAEHNIRNRGGKDVTVRP